VESSLLKERLKILLAVAQELLGFGGEAAQPALQPLPILQLTKLPAHGPCDARILSQIPIDLFSIRTEPQFVIWPPAAPHLSRHESLLA
jgi:hypothetical protein